MKKKIVITSIFLTLVFSIIVFIAAQNESSPDSIEQASNPVSEIPLDPAETSSATNPEVTPTTTEPSSNNVNGDLKNEAEFNVDSGMTPDNPFYFIKDTYQRIAVGDNPEKALDYREQKIAEAKAMVEKGKPEQAQKVLGRAIQYGDIVEKEVSPDIKNRVEESSQQINSVLGDLKEKASDEGWTNVEEKFDENIEQEKRIGVASELVSKISELCNALAQLDPLQYQDTCRAKGNSPQWMKERDKELTTEQQAQAKIFFDKLSQCFESPEDCDCKGMGIQKFEDFCLEKSAIAIKCNAGDENACKEFSSGVNPTELLPDYLISTFKKVESKYTKSEMNMYMPPECEKKGATTPEECGKIMFSLNAPQECIDAGLTGKSSEDEIKCNEIMFKSNPPQECIDAGISLSNTDGARKCAKIMFSINSPQECIDAGITGESRGDGRKCRQMTSQEGQMQDTQKYAPKFNRDCKAIQDANEKMKCFEEFYNNAQMNFREDFAQKGTIDQNTGGKITPEEEKARQECKSKGMNTILEYENRKRVIICVNEGEANQIGQRCQSQQQIENLKQDCKNRGQSANVENRGGCPWVICVGGDYRGEINGQTIQREVRQGASGEGSIGIKCPDNICDSYERMNPWACPEDCGGTRQPGNYQPPQNSQQPENRIDQPQQPNQNQENFCSGQAPSCAPNGAPFCQNGNWVCPSAPPQEPNQQQEQQPIQSIQEPEQAPAPSPTPEPASEPSPAPVTGGVITDRVIASEYGDEARFLDYWFGK
ncbi:MAG: DUF5667 domain-containing protein [Nanoarchaeota archaeon]